ncbi:NAD-dependent succinate-semialdehyde dehydrogenase [Legionella dresdenensis]|uniref:NAD-dependent succinate-semialdehyde dehydrogenase n=1 Tax=Legionella dresdenensis TaxID=450200 RepID=A0ABV8CG30_9GAMM
MNYQTINPATEEVLQTYEVMNQSALDQALLQADKTFNSWKKTDFAHRSRLMLALADLLIRKRDELGLIITREMGKPVTQSRAEIEKCAWVCRHYAEHAEQYLEPRSIATNMAKTLVTYRPLGVIFAIMPWNYPFWQVFRFAAPTIMAGNAALLKHAPISLGAGDAIMQLFIDAGFPPHIFQHLIINNDQAATVIAHDTVKALSFTGSEQTGRLVGSLAAANLKKAVLELGGNDPYIILHDADIEQAANAIVTSRLNNCGQVCIAAKRIIVDENIHDQLVKRITALMANYIPSDPASDSSAIGPMARKDLRDKLHQQVVESVSQGAELVCGGEIPSGEGYYYPPTLLLNVKPGIPAFDQELFGPVIVIIRAGNEQQAIELANLSRYGLGAAVFTSDIAHGEYIAANLVEAGTCFVNSFVASDPRVPFGGIKCSGHGRELSREGILEFVNTKTVAIK